MIPLLTGFVLGLVGSGHCAAMCGPLVLAIGPRLARSKGGWSAVGRTMLYHGGRVSTYLVLALPAGLAGQLLSLSGLERVAAVCGAVVLVGAAFGAGRARIWTRFSRLPSTAAVRGCAAAAQWARGRPLAGTFGAGAANGLMPCGLVYAAVVAAAGTGSTSDAVTMMLGFGLGTIPVLIALSMAAVTLPAVVRARAARLTPVVLVLAAALLLVRAFDLAPHGLRHGDAGHHHTVVTQR